ncbi:NAD(+) diphosphatase [Membranihabitans marinus]
MLPDSHPYLRRLTSSHVDRHGLQRRDEDWLESIWQQSDTHVLYVERGRALISTGEQAGDSGETGVPHLQLVPAEGPLPEEAVYLGEVPAEHSPLRPDASAIGHVVAVSLTDLSEAHGSSANAENVMTADLRAIGHVLPAVEAELLTYAAAVTTWHASSAFCSGCGGTTRVASSGWERTCTQCGTSHYPRTDPAVITAVIDAEDRLLLGSAQRWESSRFSTFAGFVEAGESLEDAVVREVQEEAGIVVERVEYAGSQPWPFPRSLMVGFFAHTSDTNASADDEEIREVRWFTRRELRDEVVSGAVTLPPRSAVSYALIAAWYGGTLPEPA